MTWTRPHRLSPDFEPPSPTDPATVPLTDRLHRTLADHTVGTPEEILLAAEAEREDVPRRKLSPQMRRALLWLSTDEPRRIFRLIDWALPLGEAYLVRRYLLGGDTTEQIANDVGISGSGVRWRLSRALWRLRALQDVAWDMGEREIRASLRGVVRGKDTSVVVALFAAKFSQTMTVQRLKCRLGGRTLNLPGRRVSVVQDALARVLDALGRIEKPTREQRRLRETLTAVSRRKLWLVASSPRGRERMRVPG